MRLPPTIDESSCVLYNSGHKSAQTKLPHILPCTFAYNAFFPRLNCEDVCSLTMMAAYDECPPLTSACDSVLYLYDAGPGLCSSRRLVLGFARKRIHKLLSDRSSSSWILGSDSTIKCFVLYFRPCWFPGDQICSCCVSVLGEQVTCNF